MSKREYIEVSYKVYREAQELINEAQAQHLEATFLSQAMLEAADAKIDPAHYRACLDVHNFCMFLEATGNNALVVLSENPRGTTIDWALGR